MRVFGVVCECNPFHPGHRKLLDAAAALGADRTAAVMSGDFVQRGEPAALSKFVRARDLADAGCSLVLELPARFALSSAQEFADAAVRLLAGTGAVDTLLFGSECGDLSLLREAADRMEDPGTLEAVEALTREGLSWPAARQALFERQGRADLAALFEGPNNVLGVEYLRAIRRQGLSLDAVTVQRQEDGFTAHGVREKMKNGEDLRDLLSENSLRELEAGHTPDPELFGRLVLWKLRGMSPLQLAQAADVTGGLDSRLYAAAKTCGSLEELLEAAKTRRYTMSRIKRVVCRAVLDIGGTPVSPSYLRVLAIGPGGQEVLRTMKEQAALPVLFSLKNCPEQGQKLAQEELRATDFFNTVTRTASPCMEDYTRKLYVKNDCYV